MLNLILAFVMVAAVFMFVAVFVMETIFLARDLGRRLKNIPEAIRPFHRKWLLRTFAMRMGGVAAMLFLVELGTWTYIYQTL